MTEDEIKVLDRAVSEFRKTLDDLDKKNGEVMVAVKGQLAAKGMEESYQYLTEIYTTAYDVVRGLRDAGVWIYDE